MDTNTYKTSENIPNTNVFIYKNKEFPFNLQFASVISPKIQRNQAKISKNLKIPLIEENENKINLSEACINDFIRILQNQNIVITNDNVAGLNYLSKEYEIAKLFERTDKYILDHNELLLKSYLYKVFDDETNKDIFEDTISQRFDEFVEDNDLYELPISSLHKIFQKSQMQNKINEDIQFKFLFKCLDKYGRPASLLFENIDFGNKKAEYITNLLNEKYSKIFDFHFINLEFLKSLYFQQDSMIKYEEQCNLKLLEKDKTIEIQNQQINELKQKIINQEEEFEKYKKIQKLKNIRVLNITPTKIYSNDKLIRNPINLDFIPTLNKEDIQIHVDSYNDAQITEIIKLNKDFLNLFDILIFNNGDERYKYINSDFHLFDLVEKFVQCRGWVMMMHDFNHGQYKNQNGQPYDMFSEDIWYKGTQPDQKAFKKCKFNQNKCGDLMRFPYTIDDDFEIAKTHETPMYDPQYKIIESSEYPQYHYYSENPEKRIADCSMGHDNRITDDEKKLLFNIIYRLSQLNK